MSYLERSGLDQEINNFYTGNFDETRFLHAVKGIPNISLLTSQTQEQLYEIFLGSKSKPMIQGAMRHFPDIKERQEVLKLLLSGIENKDNRYESFILGIENLAKASLKDLYEVKEVCLSKYVFDSKELKNILSLLKSFPFLAELSIGNQDFGEFPEDIGKIYSLKKLIISQDKPISFDNAYLNNLENLEELILDGMYINSFSHQGQGFHLPNLKKLSLDLNTFTRFPGKEFEHMPQLEELNLGFNKISSLNEEDLKHLSNLKKINLEYNNFTEFPKALISGVCKNLKFIKFGQAALKNNSLRQELRILCAEKGIQLHI